MRKEMIIAIAFVLLLPVIVSAVPGVALTNYNSTLAQVSISGSPDLYAYEVNMDYTGTIGIMQSYNFLALDPSSPSNIVNGHNEKTDSIGAFSSAYESRLDSTKTAACINQQCSGLLFNITHYGAGSTMSIRYAVFVDNTGAETYVYYNNSQTGITNQGTTVIINNVGGGSVGTVQQYALKIVTPGEITVSDNNYIEVPVIIQNPGEVALEGVNLSAKVSFNDEPTGDVRIVLAQEYIDKIAPGSSENVTIKVYADTNKFGRYKITLMVNVAKPKISDYGDFYVELKKVEAGDAEQNLIFAQKMISNNPRCLELTEIVNEAKVLLDQGDYRSTIGKSKEAVSACEALLKESSVAKIKSYAPYIYAAILAILIAAVIVLIFYIYRKSKHGKSNSYY